MGSIPTARILEDKKPHKRYPSDIPILDEEYFKRRAAERYQKALQTRYETQYDYAWYPYKTTEEQDKELFVEGEITEEELQSRIERRWRLERKEAPKLAVTVYPPQKRSLASMKVGTALLVISCANTPAFLIGMLLGNTTIWIVALTVGMLALFGALMGR